MAVTFTLKADLADFGVHDRAGIKVRITAEPEIKKDSGRIHSDRPEDVTTDPDGKCSKELLSAPGLWYRVTTPYVRAINPVRFAAYIPDPLDPTTGVAFAPDTVIDLFDLMDENPSPGYDAVTLVPVELFAQVTADAATKSDVVAANVAEPIASAPAAASPDRRRSRRRRPAAPSRCRLRCRGRDRAGRCRCPSRTRPSRCTRRAPAP